jgi:L-lactate dehydrogenase complex protein LldG
MSRDHIIHKVRTALGRSAGQAPPASPPPLLRIPERSADERLHMFFAAIQALAGKTLLALTVDEAREYVETLAQGKQAVASNAPFLDRCGISSLPGVARFSGKAELRAALTTAALGITSADYALSDTGTLVMLSSPEEARMVSLLPPVHVAVLPRERLLTGLDELFTIVPDPAARTSAMVMITGPSRTADIEQILVRGVHGPGEIHVIVVDTETKAAKPAS